MSQPAIPANLVLDGQAIEHPTDVWQVRRDAQRTVLQVASGARRQQMAEQPPGHPLLGHRRAFTVSWSHLGASKDQVESLLSDPRQHELVLWRPEYVFWLGDGVRSEFHLPNDWILASDYVAPPGGVPPEKFESQIRIDDPQAAPLTVLVQEPLDYLEAGPPAAGEVWFLQNGSRFQLAAPPIAGAQIYGRIVPRYLVYESGAQQTNLGDVVREPRELVLLEA